VARLYPGKVPLKSTPQRLIWEQVKLPWQIARSDCDIFHSPALSMPLLGRRKKVATAHDLIILKHPEMMKGLARRYFADFIPKTLKKADHIIANSNSTKKDLQKYVGIPESRITVIPLGVDKEFLVESDVDLVNSVRRRFQLSADYLLSVASFEPRKNHTNILKGFKEALPKLSPETKLALVGRENAYQLKMKSLAESLGILDRVSFCGYLPTKELAALYSGAVMLVFPSIDEGFGIPIIEAFASGVPVVTSKIEAIQEVAGVAAQYVNPQRHEEIADAISDIYTNTVHRENLILLGSTRAVDFSWDKHARETIRIYYKVLGRTKDLK
jgi:glycosyltransferase involved in cell wall biosynthesis